MLSVLILTFNEELNIADCLDSVRWSDDVVVLDSFSTDRTVDIAKAKGAKVLQNRFVNFAEQRNFGLAQGQFKYDWILHLDADERVSSGLRQEMLAAVQSNRWDAYQIPSRTMFQGRWLKHAGLYPWYQVRLGRRTSLSFVQAGHGQREQLSPDKIGTLTSPLLHYSFSKGMHDWFEKHNRYSSAEALHFLQNGANQKMDWPALFAFTNTQRRRRALKQLSFHLPWRPLLRFFYMYILKGGFLDGQAGLTYCRLLSLYEYMTALKINELRHQRDVNTRPQTTGVQDYGLRDY